MKRIIMLIALVFSVTLVATAFERDPIPNRSDGISALTDNMNIDIDLPAVPDCTADFQPDLTFEYPGDLILDERVIFEPSTKSLLSRSRRSNTHLSLNNYTTKKPGNLILIPRIRDRG